MKSKLESRELAARAVAAQVIYLTRTRLILMSIVIFGSNLPPPQLSEHKLLGLSHYSPPPPPENYSPPPPKTKSSYNIQLNSSFMLIIVNCWLQVFVLFQYRMLEFSNRRHYFMERCGYEKSTKINYNGQAHVIIRRLAYNDFRFCVKEVVMNFHLGGYRLHAH